MVWLKASSCVLVLGLAAACDPGDEPAGGTSTSETEAVTGDPACIDGEIDCPCSNGSLCEQGLMCIEGTCQQSMADDTGSEGGEGSTSSGDGGVDECSSNEDCDVSEICAYETCTPSDEVAWEVAIIYFEPGGCRDGWGTAEVFYRYYVGTEVSFESSVQDCPSSWSEDWLPYDPLDGFLVEFWELDAFFDDFFTSICWTDDFGDCGPLPQEVLHDGGFSGYTDDGVYYFELVAEPVL